MQNGPRYLTENDINTIQLYSALTPGGSDGGWTPGSTTDLSQLGYLGQTSDGRFYRWCLIGGTATLAPGQLLVAEVQPADNTGLAIPTSQPDNTAFFNGTASGSSSALSKGSFSFNVTNGATAVTVDEFAGGYVMVNQTSGTNEGPVKYKLAGNTAAAASDTITLTLAEPLDQPEKLVAGTDTVDLYKSPYSNVNTSATLGRPVGVLTVQVPNTSSNQYLAWVQVAGDCVVNGTSTAFEPVIQSTATAGDVVVASAATDIVVGYALDTVSTAGPVSAVLQLV